MNNIKLPFTGVLIGLAITGLAVPAWAQEDTGPITRAEFSKLQNDVKEQRQLIIQMLQTEQQRYDMLLRLIQGQGGGTPIANIPSPALAEPVAAESAGAAGKRAKAEREPKNGSIEGRVSVTGGEAGEVYVYVEGVKGPPARNKSLEIRQEGKQFSPRVAVVQTGTNVVFPNFDTVFHNVFSNSPRNSFDLGTYRAGDKPRSVTLTASGVVEVFCNIHAKMNAKILVVPSAMYTKVKPDGTFRIDNVPVGARKLVAWGPHTKAAQQRIDVTPAGTQATFALERDEGAAHLNKLGQAYGSYRD